MKEPNVRFAHWFSHTLSWLRTKSVSQKGESKRTVGSIVNAMLA